MIRNSNKCINLIQKQLKNKQQQIINTNTIFGLTSYSNNNNKNIYSNNKKFYSTFSSGRTEDEYDQSVGEYNNRRNNNNINNRQQQQRSQYDEDFGDRSENAFEEYGDEFDDDDFGERLEGETAQQQFNRELREDLIELENEIMDVEPPLYKQIRYELHGLHNEDPSFWDVKRLSQVFQIHPGRVVALIRYVDIEKMELERGFPVHKDIENQLEQDWGVRLEDEFLGDDINQKTENSLMNHFSFQSGIGRNAKAINDNYKNPQAIYGGKPLNKGNRPDPIHEVPTKIPEAYPDQPIYFRGPTFVLPRKKNLVFVDTSRDPISKKLNPDPMVLIQGIDGSLRTPSSQEKSTIINKVRPQKVKRDYESILSRPIKYRLASQQIPKPEKIVITETTEGEGEKLE